MKQLLELASGHVARSEAAITVNRTEWCILSFAHVEFINQIDSIALLRTLHC